MTTTDTQTAEGRDPGDPMLEQLHREEAVEQRLDAAAAAAGLPHWRELDDAELIEAVTSPVPAQSADQLAHVWAWQIVDRLHDYSCDHADRDCGTTEKDHAAILPLVRAMIAASLPQSVPVELALADAGLPPAAGVEALTAHHEQVGRLADRYDRRAAEVNAARRQREEEQERIRVAAEPDLPAAREPFLHRIVFGHGRGR